MKLCGKCGSTKPEEDFSWKNKTKGVLNSWCKSCMKKYDRIRYTSTERSTQVRVTNDLAVERNRKHFFEVLQKSSCTDCGESDYRVLHFDHRPGVVKIKDVTRMVSEGFSLQAIDNEIEKCDCRCANHHMIITAERGGWWRATVGLN